MFLINSVSEVNAQLQHNAYQTSQAAAQNVTAASQSGATFEDWMRMYTQTAENTAPAKKESAKSTDIYMGYFLPVFMMQGSDTRPAARSR